MTIEAKIICDSISPDGIRLTTMQLKYPRFIHSEFLTHRVFSRNASSSRAIPIEKQIQAVLDDPAMPVYWGSNKAGMQAGEELEEEAIYWCKENWLVARNQAVITVDRLNVNGLHKQLANRLLEPWAHIHVVVTATEWSNFYALRRHPDAQPEMKALADAMWVAQEGSVPQELRVGKWHLPYINVQDFLLPENQKLIDVPTALKCSVARCARVSYLNHEGKTPSIEDDLKLYDRLVGSHPMHASPAEHQATPATWNDPTTLKAERHTQGVVKLWSNPWLHGNFTGWIQYRKTLEGECQ